MKPDIELWLSKNDLSKLKTMAKDSKDRSEDNEQKEKGSQDSDHCQHI